MVDTELIEVNTGAALGIKINLPNAPLLLIRAEKGYLTCGYFDRNTVEKMGDNAAIFSGVKSFKEILGSKPVFLSKGMRKQGARLTMTGRDILELLV